MRAPGAHRALIVAAALCALAAAGCSEKPPAHQLVWESALGLPTRRASLTSVVTLAGERVIATGFDRPEGLIANVPLSLIGIGTSWSLVLLPLPTSGTSVLLFGAAGLPDGSAWVVGRAADYEPEPSRITPLVYRYAAGVWSEVAITGLGDLDGVVLEGVAARPTGSGMEVRVVGGRGPGLPGIALRFANGVWSRDSLPPSALAGGWNLAAVGCAPDGRWYAAGGSEVGEGAVLYVDDGGGWKPRIVPAGYSALQLTSLGFDAAGTPWITGNFSVGDSLQGALFSYRAGALAPVAIARRSAGGYRLFGIGFDAEGHGWAVGGRSGYQPFLAGSSGGNWTEMISQVERDEPGGGTGGGDLFAVSVTGAEAATAVGFKQELDPKGLTESELLVYQLKPQPLGEIDLRSVPVAPRMRVARPGAGFGAGPRVASSASLARPPSPK